MQPLDRHRRLGTLVAMTLSNGVTSIPTCVVAVALPEIHEELNASLAELQWTLTAFNLTYAALLIAAGRLSDIFGRRLFFLVGSVVYGAAAAAASAAQSATWLILCVAAMGVGAAILTPASLAILRQTFELKQLGMAIGIFGTAGTIIAGVGPALGGILTQWEWRSVFWINVPIAVVFFLLAWRSTPESRSPDADRHIDYTGLAALVMGLTAVSLALIQGQTWGWKSTPTIGLLAAGIGMLVLFVLIEARVRNALVDLALFRHRNFTGAQVTVFALNFVLAAVLFFMPLYLQELLAYTPIKTGLLLLPMSATMAIGLLSGGKIAERVGVRIPITVGLVLTAAGTFLLTRLSVTDDYTRLWPALLVIGGGVGIALTPLNMAAITAVPRAASGLAAGILTTIAGLGGVFGVALTGGIFQEEQDRKLDQQLADHGLHLGDSVERTLSGYLAGSSAAKDELAKFTGNTRGVVVDAIHDSFVFGIANVMWLAAGLSLVSALFTALVMQRRPPAEEEEGLREAPAPTAA
jgi:EmrB/QacA subfamily drug resistance transporter